MIERPRLFVGYDPDEALAWSVFAHSIQKRASQPVSITPLMLSQLGRIFVRERDPLQSTDFAFTRFLVPYLCGYEGWAIFADGDMICRADILELWELRDDQYAVMVVKHEHDGTEGSKFLGRQQTAYPRKNWSSVMLFNNHRCHALTPDYVNTASGLDLHRFHWLPMDGRDIGELPAAWNHLVGVRAPNPDAKLVHYTLGLPFWTGYNECEYAREWRAERESMMAYRGNGDEGCRLLRTSASAR